jgi:hypothetical protein
MLVRILLLGNARSGSLPRWSSSTKKPCLAIGARFQASLQSAVGDILNGGKPAELPVERSAKGGLAINLKAPKALGVDTPPKALR